MASGAKDVGAKKARRRRGRAKQLELPMRSWGGARKGAGRKPKNGIAAGVGHDVRDAMKASFPVHVTMKLREHLPKLRQKAEYAALRTAFGRAKERFGFRLCHYVVWNDHLHLICEAADRAALRSGLQGLAIRVARALNRLWRHKGKVFADRYHDRVLRTPREVRNALAYVFGNARQHAAKGRMVRATQAVDTFSSAPWFDGFRERVSVRGMEAIERPLADARSWLLRTGWRRHGLIPIAD